MNCVLLTLFTEISMKLQKDLNVFFLSFNDADLIKVVKENLSQKKIILCCVICFDFHAKIKIEVLWRLIIQEYF